MNEPRRLCQRAACCDTSQLMMPWSGSAAAPACHTYSALPLPLPFLPCPAGWASAMFVAMLSLGEAIWSPRWYGELHGYLFVGCFVGCPINLCTAIWAWQRRAPAGQQLKGASQAPCLGDRASRYAFAACCSLCRSLCRSLNAAPRCRLLNGGGPRWAGRHLHRPSLRPALCRHAAHGWVVGAGGMDQCMLLHRDRPLGACAGTLHWGCCVSFCMRSACPSCRPPRAGMISGALLQRYCPDNGQCTERTDSSGGGGDARRRLLALLLGRGGSASASRGGWLRSLAEGAAGGEGGPGGGEPYVCNGRALWSIVGAITLSSPLLVLLTQVGCMAGVGRVGAQPQPRPLVCRYWRDVAACRGMLLL